MRQAFKTQVEVERRRFSIFTFNKMPCRNQSSAIGGFECLTRSLNKSVAVLFDGLR